MAAKEPVPARSPASRSRPALPPRRLPATRAGSSPQRAASRRHGSARPGPALPASWCPARAAWDAPPPRAGERGHARPAPPPSSPLASVSGRCLLTSVLAPSLGLDQGCPTPAPGFVSCGGTILRAPSGFAAAPASCRLRRKRLRKARALREEGCPPLLGPKRFLEQNFSERRCESVLPLLSTEIKSRCRPESVIPSPPMTQGLKGLVSFHFQALLLFLKYMACSVKMIVGLASPLRFINLS